MRVLLRRLKAENWQFKRSRWNIDANGVGTATVKQLAQSAATHLLHLRMICQLKNDRIG